MLWCSKLKNRSIHVSLKFLLEKKIKYKINKFYGQLVNFNDEVT